jgi:hypothetical protein
MKRHFRVGFVIAALMAYGAQSLATRRDSSESHAARGQIQKPIV